MRNLCCFSWLRFSFILPHLFCFLNIHNILNYFRSKHIGERSRNKICSRHNIVFIDINRENIFQILLSQAFKFIHNRSQASQNLSRKITGKCFSLRWFLFTAHADTCYLQFPSHVSENDVVVNKAVICVRIFFSVNQNREKLAYLIDTREFYKHK